MRLETQIHSSEARFGLKSLSKEMIVKRQKVESKSYIVKWYSKSSPSISGQSEVLMSYADAEAWADYSNRKYPDIKHEVVEAIND